MTIEVTPLRLTLILVLLFQIRLSSAPLGIDSDLEQSGNAQALFAQFEAKLYLANTSCGACE
jgi:hypothetical protein